MSRDQVFLKRLGLKLREIRMTHTWTLEEAEEHGWPDWSHLQKIEAGKKDITVTTLNRLAKLYKVHPSDLLKGL